ncbi:hypothetical protein HYQ45_018097 [Verticillium longisporum]|uniref:Uncharacterized protein n=1 Tax=Verticillium longisporum TaxID=100787 RepID=A0A8I2Z399_VERLO|nr:hypothetical protein HYQ45_018097 [Verticillium longisporum]
MTLKTVIVLFWRVRTINLIGGHASIGHAKALGGQRSQESRSMSIDVTPFPTNLRKKEGLHKLDRLEKWRKVYKMIFDVEDNHIPDPRMGVGDKRGVRVLAAVFRSREYTHELGRPAWIQPN